jgi:hypothetical protein
MGLWSPARTARDVMTEVRVHLRRWAELNPFHPPEWLAQWRGTKRHLTALFEVAETDFVTDPETRAQMLPTPELLQRWAVECVSRAADPVPLRRWFVVGSEEGRIVHSDRSQEVEFDEIGNIINLPENNIVIESKRVESALSVLLPPSSMSKS